MSSCITKLMVAGSIFLIFMPATSSIFHLRDPAIRVSALKIKKSPTNIAELYKDDADIE
jgi:hypothetical protein